MKKYLKWIIPAVALVALIGVAAYLLIPGDAKNENRALDWSLKGACVSRSGVILKDVDFSIKGEVVPKETDDPDRIKGSMYLTFTFPADYRYDLTDSYQGDESSRFVYFYDNLGAAKADHPMVLTPMPFDLQTSEYIMDSCFTMDIDKGYFLFYVEQEPDRFLVGSVDGKADPATILQRFEFFISAACKDKTDAAG